MIELIIKVKADEAGDIIGIKENIAVALEEIHGVTAVEVVDVYIKGELR